MRGRGKTAWAPLLAHARRSDKNMGIHARLYIIHLISRNISVHDYECLSSCTSAGVKLCSEKTLDMPFLAYYGCSKPRAVFYWGTHTRFTVSVGLDAVLEVPIVYAWPRELELGNCILLGYVHCILSSM